MERNPGSVYGGYFSATSDNGVYATSSGNDASYGLASTSGYAGVHGQSTNAGGYGVYGNNTATSGYAFGGYFDSNYGIGLAGITGNSAGGFGAGVYASGSKYGVWGQPTGGLSGAIGVYGTDDSNDSSYGIEAVANGRGSTALEALANGANTTAIYALGNVNIVSGCLEFNGVSYHGTCASDERLKKNIQPVKAGLDELAKLRPVSFDWIDPTAHAGSRGETGFLAQEVAKVFPQWVGTRSDGFLTLEIPPRELAGLLVNALRTLKTDNDDLRQEVGELRGQVTAIASGHPIPASGFNFGGSNVGLLGLAAAIAYAASRRKPNEKQS